MGAKALRLKNNMKKRFLILTLFFLTANLASVAGFAAGPGDDLWQRAVAVAEADRHWVPGTMFARMEQKDAKGRILNLERSWYRLFADPKGKIAYEPVKVLQNGKDVTKAVKNQMDALKKEGTSAENEQFGLTGCNPFAPENQKTITVKPLDAKRKIVLNGRTCLAYDFTLREATGDVISGTAWLEEGTGIPRKLQYSPRNLPQFIRKMTNTVWYKTTDDGHWVVDRMLFEATGQYLVIKKYLRTFVKYDQHWLYRPDTTGESGANK
jgi:hypothetical protein